MKSLNVSSPHNRPLVQVVGNGRPGGGATAVLTLSRMLAASGCDVVVVSEQGSYVVEQAAAAGLQAHGLDFSSRLNTLRLAMALSRCFEALRPAVVHAHGARAGLPAVIASRWARAQPASKLVYTVHGFAYPSKPAGLLHLGRAAEALCMSAADCTNFVSDGDRLIAERDGLLRRARAHRTIKNAVPVDATLASAPKEFDLGFLGRIDEQKNPLLLVDILVAMRPLKPRLSIIGGGPLEHRLRARIAEEGLGDQVVLHGEQTRSDALRLASSCRVLVLPSVWEGHPIALVEAMHMGIPVVASDISGSNEIVVEGETGYLVPARNAGAYASALARLLGNAGALEVMKRNASARAREYSPERMLREHVQLYGMQESAAVSATVGAMP
jgi:glycosyltransferase involved in cell wall biosynthesis